MQVNLAKSMVPRRCYCHCRSEDPVYGLHYACPMELQFDRARLFQEGRLGRCRVNTPTYYYLCMLVDISMLTISGERLTLLPQTMIPLIDSIIYRTSYVLIAVLPWFFTHESGE